jgi:hypothetical protein
MCLWLWLTDRPSIPPSMTPVVSLFHKLPIAPAVFFVCLQRSKRKPIMLLRISSSHMIPLASYPSAKLRNQPNASTRIQRPADPRAKTHTRADTVDSIIAPVTSFSFRNTGGRPVACRYREKITCIRVLQIWLGTSSHLSPRMPARHSSSYCNCRSRCSSRWSSSKARMLTL